MLQVLVILSFNTLGVGIGGGALFVPIMSVFLQISPTTAVPLSKVATFFFLMQKITIFGVAIGGLVILLRKRHPKANRPLIDFHIALLMGPLTLVGTIIGVWFNIIFPVYVLIIFLVLILSATIYKTYVKVTSFVHHVLISKGFELLKKERESAKVKPEEPKEKPLDTKPIELKEISEQDDILPGGGGVVPLLDNGTQNEATDVTKEVIVDFNFIIETGRLYRKFLQQKVKSLT